MTEPSHVAILRFGAVGDMILTAPAVEALRSALPNTQITYVTKTAMAPLLEASPYINNILRVSRGESTRSIVQRLRTAQVDHVLDWHGKLRSKLIRWQMPTVPSTIWTKRPFGTGIPVRLGWKTWRPTTLLADRFHTTVETLVGRSLNPGRLQAFPSTAGRNEATTLLEELGVHSNDRLLGLSPGANWQTKRWPIEKFGALAAEAAEAGWKVLVTGSAGERHLFEALHAHAPRALNAMGTSLAGLVGTIERCQAYVANDSGPMHISRGLGVPTIALFGCTPPTQFDFTGHTLMFEQQPCAPCHFYGRTRCPKGHFDCMRRIEVSDVSAVLKTFSARTTLPLLRG